jgi:hypothetical protein
VLIIINPVQTRDGVTTPILFSSIFVCGAVQYINQNKYVIFFSSTFLDQCKIKICFVFFFGIKTMCIRWSNKKYKLMSSGKDGDVVGLGLPFSTESEKESE